MIDFECRRGRGFCLQLVAGTVARAKGVAPPAHPDHLPPIMGRRNLGDSLPAVRSCPVGQKGRAKTIQFLSHVLNLIPYLLFLRISEQFDLQKRARRQIKTLKLSFLDASSVCPSVCPHVRYDFSETADNNDLSLRDASYYPPGLVCVFFTFKIY